MCWIVNREVRSSKSCQGAKMFGDFCSTCTPSNSAEKLIHGLIHCWWEEQMLRETTDPLPLNAEAENANPLTCHTHGLPRDTALFFNFVTAVH